MYVCELPYPPLLAYRALNLEHLPSVTSFARDNKWGCRLYMTSLSMGRKTQPTNLNLETGVTNPRPPFLCSRAQHARFNL